MRPPSLVFVENTLWVVTENTGFAQYDFAFKDHFCSQHPYQINDPIKAVARMGAAPDYTQRYEALREWGMELVHTPDDYVKTSY